MLFGFRFTTLSRRRSGDEPVPEHPTHRPVWKGLRRVCVCGLRWPCVDRRRGSGGGTAAIPHEGGTPGANPRRDTPGAAVRDTPNSGRYDRSGAAPRRTPGNAPGRHRWVAAHQAGRERYVGNNGWTARTQVRPWTASTAGPAWNRPTQARWVGVPGLLTPGQAARTGAEGWR